MFTAGYQYCIDVKRERETMSPKKILEWFGVLTAIAYSLLVASNTGYEVLGFSLLFISAISIGLWAFFFKHYGILLLQFFYAAAGVIGIIRWL
jgi:hypothetical protein